MSCSDSTRYNIIILQIVVISGATGTQNSIFGQVPGIRQKMGRLKIEQGFSSFFAIFDDFSKFYSTFGTCSTLKKASCLQPPFCHQLRFFFPLLLCHSSRFQSLCSTKCFSNTLQNLPYFIYAKTQSCFFCFSSWATLYFSLMNALVKQHEMNNGKGNFGFWNIYIINMANSEAFCWNISSSTNSEIGKSGVQKKSFSEE